MEFNDDDSLSQTGTRCSFIEFTYFPGAPRFTAGNNGSSTTLAPPPSPASSSAASPLVYFYLAQGCWSTTACSGSAAYQVVLARISSPPPASSTVATLADYSGTETNSAANSPLVTLPASLGIGAGDSLRRARSSRQHACQLAAFCRKACETRTCEKLCPLCRNFAPTSPRGPLPDKCAHDHLRRSLGTSNIPGSACTGDTFLILFSVSTSGDATQVRSKSSLLSDLSENADFAQQTRAVVWFLEATSSLYRQVASNDDDGSTLCSFISAYIVPQSGPLSPSSGATFALRQVSAGFCSSSTESGRKRQRERCAPND